MNFFRVSWIHYTLFMQTNAHDHNNENFKRSGKYNKRKAKWFIFFNYFWYISESAIPSLISHGTLSSLHTFFCFSLSQSLLLLRWILFV